MAVDVIFLFFLLSIVIIGYFVYRVVPILRNAVTEQRQHPERKKRLYLLEERLHETESPEAIACKDPFIGAAATNAAAKDHFALAEEYKKSWRKAA